MYKLDYSKTNDYYTCPRKYYLRHVKNIVSVHGSTALRFGSAFHAGMEGYYSYIRDHGWDRSGKAIEQAINFAKDEFEKESENKTFLEDYRSFPAVAQLIVKYIEHFYLDEQMLKVRNTERAFKLLMEPTPSDEDKYPWIKPFFFTGKIDLEYELNGANWVNEFKTTGWSIQALSNELTRSPQILGYAYASKHVYDIMPEGVMVVIAYAKAAKSRKTGDYGNISMDFARIPQIFNEYDLREWRTYFIDLVAQIQHSHLINHFPPRFQSCFNYGRCTYLNLCEQSRPLDQCSYNGYVEGQPWDVLTEVKDGAVIEGVEK